MSMPVEPGEIQGRNSPGRLAATVISDLARVKANARRRT
jgi:hypothetical protein